MSGGDEADGTARRRGVPEVVVTNEDEAGSNGRAKGGPGFPDEDDEGESPAPLRGAQPRRRYSRGGTVDRRRQLVSPEQSSALLQPPTPSPPSPLLRTRSSSSSIGCLAKCRAKLMRSWLCRWCGIGLDRLGKINVRNSNFEPDTK